MRLSVEFAPANVGVEIPSAALDVSTGIPVAREYVERTAYEGPTEIIPAASPQVLQTNGLRMTDNITIGAIPNNYGLISWDGSRITVS